MEITCRPADSDVWETLNREKIRQQIRWETVKHHEESTGERIHDWTRLEALKAPFVQKVEEDFRKKNETLAKSKGKGKGKGAMEKTKPVPKKLVSGAKNRVGMKKKG